MLQKRRCVGPEGVLQFLELFRVFVDHVIALHPILPEVVELKREAGGGPR